MNLDLTDFDVGMNDCVFSDDQVIVRGNRTVEVAIDAERPGEVEFAGDIGSFVEKPADLVGWLAAEFHIELPGHKELDSSKLRLEQALIQPIHFLGRIEVDFDLPFTSVLLDGNLCAKGLF